MQLYNFEVLNGDRLVSEARATMSCPCSTWRKIAGLALEASDASWRIRVTDEHGGIVILTGVAAARRVAERLAA